MARVKNPFVVTGKIEREYFCDRVEESRKIVKSINNGNNIVLISPRRMGKTGLMRYCYDFEFGKDEYYTLFIQRAYRNLLIFLAEKYTKQYCPRARR